MCQNPEEWWRVLEARTCFQQGRCFLYKSALSCSGCQEPRYLQMVSMFTICFETDPELRLLEHPRTFRISSVNSCIAMAVALAT
jgi:hypothetical protein